MLFRGEKKKDKESGTALMVLLEVGQVLRRQPRGTGKWKVESMMMRCNDKFKWGVSDLEEKRKG